MVGSAWKQGDGAAARFAADLPPQVDEPVLIGPRLVELCFQTVGLLEAGTDGVLALPLHVDAVRLDGGPAERAGLVATARPDGHGGFNCTVRDDEGTLVLRLDGYRTVPLPEPAARRHRRPDAARRCAAEETYRYGQADSPAGDRQPR